LFVRGRVDVARVARGRVDVDVDVDSRRVAFASRVARRASMCRVEKL
jgi:hypothetical protein